MTNVKFSSHEAMAESCIQLVVAFGELHLKGFAYHDFDETNIFIEPTKGDVKVLFSDSIALSGTCEIVGIHYSCDRYICQFGAAEKCMIRDLSVHFNIKIRQ